MSAHNVCCVVLSLWSLIAGIVTLTLNDKSPCAESHQTLMVLGIGLIVFSVLYIINSCVYLCPQENIFPFLLSGFVIFVFVLDCMLIDEVVRGNESEDCSGGRGTLRLFIIGWMAPLLLVQCLPLLMFGPKHADMSAFYYGRQNAEFQTLVL